MKNYTQAPLSFMGRKKRFVKDFKKVLAAYPDDVTIVDLFGGSGLLSRAAKQEKPLAKVVYNDLSINTTLNYASQYTDVMLYSNK